MEVTTHSISSWAAGDKTGMLAFGIGISTRAKVIILSALREK